MKRSTYLWRRAITYAWSTVTLIAMFLVMLCGIVGALIFVLWLGLTLTDFGRK